MAMCLHENDAMIAVHVRDDDVQARQYGREIPEEGEGSVFADDAVKTPVGRIGSADDVARTIAFLVTNSFMTGEVIVCDGGLRFAG